MSTTQFASIIVVLRRAAAVVITAAVGLACAISTPALAAERPNILWITAEDISPDLGCYGDAYAVTPTLDKLASQGARFARAFTIAGVCAPSRSGIITAMYPTTIGTQHMRSKGVPPEYVRCFTEYLRAAGYYCTNNVKTDYNFDPPLTAWDESSNKAHWRNRGPGQPFFAVFNINTTHESQIRQPDDSFAEKTARLRPQDRHDPAKAVLPPYYPDTPVVRQDWARYYDLITAMDLQVADMLRQLDEDGLTDNTVVVFFGDHGRGLPRAKRWTYDSGIHIPLLIRWPGRIKPGSVNDELISMIDAGPTMLSIAGIETSKHMQGRAFLGEHKAEPRDYIFAARDRMDETYDIIRAVRDRRYKYIRNFKPGRPYAQYIGYMELMPTMQEMRRLNKSGELTGAQRIFFLPEKPEEELYDLESDPHEVRNLAGDAGHRDVLEKMRGVLAKWMKDTKDTGLLPEDELKERMRPGGVWQTTKSPTLTATGGEARAGVTVSLSCATPGASIAYRLDPPDGAARPSAQGWKLYSEPITIPQSAKLHAIACRLGYHDSPEVVLWPAAK